ncbi:MAG: putative oxidoreductase [Planctomycetota bacterium]|jgi:putative oxidoreductase
MTTQKMTRNDWGLFLLRAMIGVVFVFHGGQKLFGLFGGYGLEATAGWMESINIPFPMLSATLAGATEFFGGILLIIGFAVRLVGIPLAITMFVAAGTHTGFNIQSGGMEYALTLAIASLALSLTGPGAIAVPMPKKKSANVQAAS